MLYAFSCLEALATILLRNIKNISPKVQRGLRDSLSRQRDMSSAIAIAIAIANTNVLPTKKGEIKAITVTKQKAFFRIYT